MTATFQKQNNNNGKKLNFLDVKSDHESNKKKKFAQPNKKTVLH